MHVKLSLYLSEKSETEKLICLKLSNTFRICILGKNLHYLHTRKSTETCHHPRISEIILLGVQGDGEYMKRERCGICF